MPDINIDVDIDLNDALRFACADDIHAWLEDEKGESWLADQLGDDDMLAVIDNDRIKEYAIEHCGLVEDE